MEHSEEHQEQTHSEPIRTALRGTRAGHLQRAAHSLAPTPTASITRAMEEASDNNYRISLSILCSEIQLTSLPLCFFLGNSTEG